MRRLGGADRGTDYKKTGDRKRTARCSCSASNDAAHEQERAIKDKRSEESSVTGGKACAGGDSREEERERERESERERKGGKDNDPCAALTVSHTILSCAGTSSVSESCW